MAQPSLSNFEPSFEVGSAHSIQFVIAETPPPSCGHMSSTNQSAMRCELPPDHDKNEAYPLPFHHGRNRNGAWRSWPL